MDRNKLPVTRIENQSSRLALYSKRKEGIVKKAYELSVLCDTDIGLVMFPHDGQVTSFASNGRVEDVFLRFLKRPDECKGGPVLNEKYLVKRLEELKAEAEMLEKLAKLEALEDILYKLNRLKCEAQEKIRCYKPDVEKMSQFEAGVCQRFLENAIQQIDESKVQLLVNGDEQHIDNETIEGGNQSTVHFPNANTASNDYHQGEASTSQPDLTFSQLAKFSSGSMFFEME